MTYKTISIAIDAQGIAVCTFNRPQVRNALNLQMVQEIRRALDDLVANDDIRVLIFSGGDGKVFVSGADIAELRERTKRDAMLQINTGLFRDIETFTHPTIAAINGFALGGGCELALACDIRVCTVSSKIGQPEVGLGIMPGAGATYRLSRVIGPGMARELILTGRVIDGNEAARIGLVNHVVANGEAMTKARAIAQEICLNGALAVRFSKLALRTTPEMSTDAAIAFEASVQAVLFEDAEKMRRMDDFLARRSDKKRG
ncbi:MAG: enoyl-CoA hydratase-related protein [Myxococcota bacterium]